MPGPRSHGGWRRHVRIARNQANQDLGATPSPLNWNWVPLLGDGFKLKATSPRYVPETNYGGDFRRHVAIHYQQIVEGDLTTLLWPELTQFLFDMALLRVNDVTSQNHEDIYGHVVDHYTPDDPRRYYGVVVNSMRLSATGTGDNDVQITHSCIAQREVENDVLVEGDVDYSGVSAVPFMFAHADLQIHSVHVTDVENWNLTIENNVGDAPKIQNAAAALGVRAHAIANQRTITLELTKLNNSDRFNEAIRDGGLLTFQATFTHPAGHILQIILPSLYTEESDEDGTPSAQAKESPTLEARAANTGPYAGCDIVYAVDLAEGGTTTLAPITTTTVVGATTTTTVGATTTTTAVL